MARSFHRLTKLSRKKSVTTNTSWLFRIRIRRILLITRLFLLTMTTTPLTHPVPLLSNYLVLKL
ncbi:hypothetical protein OESDEN_23853 [Oesophagostomum dentatum]|uniref:Uncharacterized protein n=1 Tax=Oesophagostomum dentatum TaxID=61180 RepID=A0A0B1RZ77_OESDE|nr:hypothetical protein OESDEN_23853 [Oesophagostomum dentatum]